jgi:ATP-binding cassette, subfamily F, member 3
MEGEMNASGKMRVGYFTQYQVEELDRDETPLQHMTLMMKGASQGAVRGQLGRFGFEGHKATTQVGKLSGGERARLALALITRDAPHMLILDEPTNHLDVDAREALIQALNAYSGAVVIVSHDRHMLEMTADRLVLVDSGTAKDFDGSIEDYIAFVLSKDDKSGKGEKKGRKAALSRDKEKELKKLARDAEAELARLVRKREELDATLAGPTPAGQSMSALMKQRSDLDAQVEAAEAAWMEASEALEAAAA